MSSHTVICIGSNIESRRDVVEAVLAELSALLADFRASDIYYGADDSGLGEPYANAVCSGRFDGSLQQLLDYAARRETDFGRTPQSKTLGIMPLDVDVIIFDGEVVCPRQFSRPYFQTGYRRLTDTICQHTPK